MASGKFGQVSPEGLVKVTYDTIYDSFRLFMMTDKSVGFIIDL